MAIEKLKVQSKCVNCLFVFETGDIVGLQLFSAELNEEYLSSGVVTKARDDVITVAFDVVKVVPDDLYRLIKLCNDVTYKRMKE